MPFFNWFPEFCFDVQLQCSHKDDVSINTECDNTLPFIFEQGFVFGCYFCQSTFVNARHTLPPGGERGQDKHVSAGVDHEGAIDETSNDSVSSNATGGIGRADEVGDLDFDDASEDSNRTSDAINLCTWKRRRA